MKPVPVKYPFQTTLLLTLVITLCVSIYLPGLKGPFFLDDNPQLTPLFSLAADFSSTDIGEHLHSRSGYLGRPVSMATFVLNAVLHGDDTWYWKLTNVLIHIVIGIVIFLLTVRLCRNFYTKSDSRNIALLVTALWLLHPLQVSTVLYTVQRMSQLSALFIFLGMLSYTVGRQAIDKGKISSGWLYILAAFLLCFPMSAFSKENGILLPLMLLIVEVFVFRFYSVEGQKKYLLAIFTGFLILPLVIGLYFLSVDFDHWVLRGYATRDFTLIERVLTQLRVLVLYLVQILFPLPSNFGFFHDDINVSSNLLSPPQTLFSLLLLLALLIGSVLARKKYPLLAVGVFMFFASHVLESTIFPLELMFEHRNYLASYGIVLCLGILLVKLLHRKEWVMKAVPVFVVIFAALLLGFRVQAWSSENSMYLYMQKQRPDSRRLAVIVANMYAENGFYARARHLLKRFDGVGFQVNLLYMNCMQKGALQADDFNQISMNKESLVDLYASEAIMNLANLGLDEHCKFDSMYFIDLVDHALRARVRSKLARQKLLMYKAHYLHRDNRLYDAVAALDAAFYQFDENPVPLFLVSEWFIDNKQYDKAQIYYQKAVNVSNKTGRNYSEFIDDIGKRFEEGVSTD